MRDIAKARSDQALTALMSCPAHRDEPHFENFLTHRAHELVAARNAARDAPSGSAASAAASAGVWGGAGHPPGVHGRSSARVAALDTAEHDHTDGEGDFGHPPPVGHGPPPKLARRPPPTEALFSAGEAASSAAIARLNQTASECRAHAHEARLRRRATARADAECVAAQARGAQQPPDVHGVGAGFAARAAGRGGGSGTVAAGETDGSEATSRAIAAHERALLLAGCVAPSPVHLVTPQVPTAPVRPPRTALSEARARVQAFLSAARRAQLARQLQKAAAGGPRKTYTGKGKGPKTSVPPPAPRADDGRSSSSSVESDGACFTETGVAKTEGEDVEDFD